MFSKIYALSIAGSVLYGITKGSSGLSTHINSLEGNYVGFRGYRIEISQILAKHGRFAAAIAIGATSFSFFREYIK